MLWAAPFLFFNSTKPKYYGNYIGKIEQTVFEQMLCVHIVMCSFVVQRQQELMEAGLMDEEVIKMYRNNVEHLIPGSDDAFVQSTNELLWNLIVVAADSLAKGVNVDFAKEVIEKASEAWEKAEE